MGANNLFKAWTADREDELRAHWEVGNSATVIARSMNITRNSVLGKVHRIKLKSRAPEKKANPKPAPRSVFRTREIKPRLKVSNPGEWLMLLPVVSTITGALITTRKRRHVREMTKIELRAMLTQAVINTGGTL